MKLSRPRRASKQMINDGWFERLSAPLIHFVSVDTSSKQFALRERLKHIISITFWSSLLFTHLKLTHNMACYFTFRSVYPDRKGSYKVRKENPCQMVLSLHFEWYFCLLWLALWTVVSLIILLRYLSVKNGTLLSLNIEPISKGLCPLAPQLKF